jgi:hypothetical protein
MTWETESASDVQSQSQMTTDTYGYGDGDGGDQNIIWSDDPETAYLKSMIGGGQEDSSLIGDSTINGLLEERGRAVDVGHQDDSSGFLPAGDTPTNMHDTNQSNASFEPMIDSSGLSYYDTDGDDDTIGKIKADADDSGWFAARRQKFDTNHPPPNNEQFLRAPAAPSPRVAYDIKSPISALSPQDKAGEGNRTSQPGFAVPNPNLIPESPGNRPVAPSTPVDIMADLGGYTEDGKIIPGYIFVTAGHSSAVQTKKSLKDSKKSDSTPKKSRFSFGRANRQSATPKVSNKKAQVPIAKEPASKPAKQGPSVNTDDEEERIRRRKYFLCKVGIVFLMMALAVGIAMLSIVFKSKRGDEDTPASNANGDVGPPTMPPNFFLPPPETPTSTPTSPPRGVGTNSPTDTGMVQTVSPTLAPTPMATFATGPPTTSPVVAVTAAPIVSPGTPGVGTVKEFLVTQFPSSADALADTTSAQYRALEWIAQDMTGTRRVRGRALQEGDLDWRLTQRWLLAVVYFATGGNTIGDTTTPSWRSSAGWLEFPDECQWAFVTCNDDLRVSELIIQDNSLVGSIPPEVGLFGDALSRLSLNSNAIEGSLPTTLGLLKGLNRLTATGNQLTDQLPTQLGDMTELRFLALSRNLFNGPIPSQLGSATNLRTIDLALTNIEGTIPTELGNLVALEFISLGSTRVSGTIPSEMGNLPLLTGIKIAQTDLEGEMPAGICNRNLADEIKADCQEVDCPCCTVCCVDGGGCTGTTPSPTKFPTLSPISMTTTSPTPTLNQTIDFDLRNTLSPTESPTADPTVNPTPVPTMRQATSTPTVKQTQAPTLTPTSSATTATPQATNAPTAAPTSSAPTLCEAALSTDKECYENGSDVVVFFNNCNALFDDWVGVYAAGTVFSVLDEPIAWVWTAGDQFMQRPVSSGNITFSEARGAGNFQVVIARNRQGPPYRAYGVSTEFRLADNCSQ